jgi:UDP-2,3-diacylglucosamine pyrophosphatase LpxH
LPKLSDGDFLRQHSKARVHLPLKFGIVIVGSDLHAWPGQRPTAFRAFLKFCKELKPAAVIMNGDAFDGASISRHPSIGWEKVPSVIEELGAVQDRLREIEDAAPRARLLWPAGNHDIRYETRLAAVAREYSKVSGFHLKDHFSPRWTPCWSVWLNNDVVVKHRAKRNAARFAGKTMICGHTHALAVTPFTDYNGTRFDVNTGCLADPNGPQFVNYSEDSAKDHRAGFVVVTIHKKKLLDVELVRVLSPNELVYRGSIIRV